MNAPIFSHTRWFFAARCAGVAALAFNSSLSARAASVDDPPADSKSAASFGQTLRRAWTGAWMGEVRAPAADGAASPSMPVTLIVRPGLPAPLVEVTIMRAGAMAKPAVDVVAAGDTLAFTLDAGGRQARFEGTLLETPTGATISGSFAFLDAQGASVAPALQWTMRAVDLVTDLDDAKVFAGVLDAQGQKIPMRIALGEGPRGWCGAIEIISQGLRNFAMEVERTTTGFTLRIPVGVAATVMLKPEADADARSVLSGTFQQGNFVGPIRFEEVIGAKLGTASRPQDPQPPFPYTEREVRIAHPAGHTLAGTLTMPSEQKLVISGRFPAVLLVSGSGPQDRDETIFGHRPFAVIADALARAGVAVLRCDDRGTASSTGDFSKATTIDFASDADIASEWLKLQQGIDPNRVGIIGHSEGALIAPLVSLWQHAGDSPVAPLAFTVLLSPPAEQGGALLTHQTKQLYDAAGVPPEQSEGAVAAHAVVMSAITERKPTDAVRVLVESLVREQLRASGTEVPDDATLKATYDGAMAQLESPWMLEFIRFDPRVVLERLESPTLAMCGTKDVQVNAATNLGILDAVAATTGAPIETKRLDGLNHMFQPAVTGVVDEYGVIDTTFEPEALASMVAWVVDRVMKPLPPQIPESGRSDAWHAADIPKRLYLFIPTSQAIPTEVRP